MPAPSRGSPAVPGPGEPNMPMTLSRNSVMALPGSGKLVGIGHVADLAPGVV